MFRSLDSTLHFVVGMSVRCTATALLTSATVLATEPVRARTASAPMHVSVQVIARAIVTVDAQQVVSVTEADVARGYVDVRTVLHARTNSRNGYMLEVGKTGTDFAAIEVELPNATMHVASHETWIRRPYVRGGEAVPVSARLFFASGATAGPHALPISFSATPL